jgi:hypothetical protein
MLPGITLKRGALGASGMSGKNMFERLEKQAVLETVADFLSLVAKKYEYNKVLDTEMLGGQWQDDAEPFGAEYVGIEFERGCSPLKTFRIDSVTVKASQDVIKTFYIKDGTEITEVTVQLLGGRPTEVMIDHVAVNDKVVVYVSRCNVDFHRVNGLCDSCTGHCSKCYRCGCVYWYNRSADSETDGVPHFEYGSYRYFQACVTCLYNECCLVRSLKDVLALPILYRFGILFIQEVTSTDRINEFTLSSPEKLNNLLFEWHHGVPVGDDRMPGKYWTYLKSAYNQADARIRKEFKYQGARLHHTKP